LKGPTDILRKLTRKERRVMYGDKREIKQTQTMPGYKMIKSNLLGEVF